MTKTIHKTVVPKLRFPEFEGVYNSSKLGNELNFFNGYAFSSNDSSEKGVRWVKIADVGINRMKLHAPSFLPIEFKEKHSKFLLHKGDFVVALTRPILGGKLKIAKIDDDFNGSLLNQRVGKLESKNDLEYMYCMLQQKSLISRIENRIAGTDPPNLSPNEIATLKTYIPTLPEQQKIATFLSAVDTKIQQLTKKAELLEQYKKGVMQKIFSQELRFKDTDGNAFPDWEEKRLGEIATFLDGRRKPIKSGDRSKMQGEYPYYGASGIIDYVNNYIFDEEIILLGEDGENIISRNLPLAFRVSGKCWVNNHAHVIKPDDYNDIDFLTFSLERINYEPFNTGTAQPKLNQAVCKGLLLNMPVFEEQQKIATYLSSIDTKIERVISARSATEQFKKGLLQQLFV